MMTTKEKIQEVRFRMFTAYLEEDDEQLAAAWLKVILSTPWAEIENTERWFIDKYQIVE